MKKIVSTIIVLFSAIGCATNQTENKGSGSSEQGEIVKIYYQYNENEDPNMHADRSWRTAKQRCVRKGYFDAKPFGRVNKFCSTQDNTRTSPDFLERICLSWRVTEKYQCIGSS